MGDHSLFVLSTGRAGSNLLAECVNEALGPGTVGHQSAGSRRVNILGHLVMAGLISPDRGLRWARRVLGSDLFASTADPLRSVVLSYWMSETPPEEATVVHLVRDPRDFVTSFMNWRVDRRRRLLLHSIPFWQPEPLIGAGEGERPARRMGRFERLAWTWRVKNRLFQTLERRSRYVRIRLEDLHDGLDHSVEARLAEIGLSDLVTRVREKGRVNAPRARSFPEWPDWSMKRATALHAHCFDLMAEYGYGGEPQWEAKVSAGRSEGARPS